MVDFCDLLGAFSQEQTLKNFKQVVSNGIASIWKENLLTDVVIRTRDGEEFPCHRLLLASTSCYFRAMFISDYQESLNGVVNFYTIDSDSLRTVLNFLYTGSLTISNETIFKLLETADFLQIQSIIDLCVSELKKHISKETCVPLLMFSLRSNSFSDLKEFALKTLLNNFKDFVNTSSFPLLPKEIIFEILRSSKLRVNSERLVFDAILSWTYSDSKRLVDICEFLDLVQFDKITLKCIEDIIIPQVKKLESDSGINFSQAGTMERILNAQMSLKTHTFTKNRLSTAARLRRENVLVFVNTSGDSATAFKIDFMNHYKDDSLGTIDTIGTCSLDICACRNRPIVLDDYLMMHSRGCLVKYRYNLKTKHQMETIRRPPGVQQKRKYLHSPNALSRTTRGSSCVELNGLIYCVGGQRGFMNQCLGYDPNGDEWNVCEGFNHPSTNPSLVSGKNAFYIIRQKDAGSDDRYRQTDVTLIGYSPVNEKMLPHISFTIEGDPDSSRKLTIHEHTVYVGHDGNITKFDTASKEHQTVQFNGEVLFISPQVCEERVYAVIVKNRMEPVLELFVEDPEHNMTWTRLLQKPLPSFHTGISVTASSSQ
ncbi:uncharacterized protein [Antedon mediterranea]|uniref:uncharacterized protein n=1 Tax=Antedon mediterranea TaxID=105859 RepID=UPI003AF49FD6